MSPGDLAVSKAVFLCIIFQTPFFVCNQVCKRVTRKVMEKVESSSYFTLTAINAHCQKCKKHIYGYIWPMVNDIDDKPIIKDEVNPNHAKTIIVWVIIKYSIYQSEIIYA